MTASLAAPAAALGSASAVIKDCAQDGKLDKTYSQADLAAARKQLPADVDEYTNCRDVIRRAQLAGSSGGSHSGGGTGSTAPGGDTSAGTPGTSAADALAAATPQERAAVQKAVAGGAAPVQIGSRTLSPNSLGVGDLTKTHSLPGPLVLVLVLLALTSTGGFVLLRRRR